jgi:peptidoglycan/LPS O-acetylase OafA/YrhL
VLVRRVGGDDPLSNAWAFLPGSIDWIAVGMGMAALSAALDAGVRRPRLVTLVERRPALAWAAAAVLFWVVSTRIGVDGRFPQPTTTLGWTAMHELYAAVAALIVAPAVFGHERGGAVRRFLRVRALAWLGLVSYGIFLYHHPIMEALATSRFARHWRDFPMLGLTATTLVLATACAAASYFLFERPILRLKRTRRSERRAIGKPTPEPVGPAL